MVSLQRVSTLKPMKPVEQSLFLGPKKEIYSEGTRLASGKIRSCILTRQTKRREAFFFGSRSVTMNPKIS